ncbi:unnamed protein product, partial [Phaeothamnion confervicola]
MPLAVASPCDMGISPGELTRDCLASGAVLPFLRPELLLSLLAFLAVDCGNCSNCGGRQVLEPVFLRGYHPASLRWDLVHRYLSDYSRAYRRIAIVDVRDLVRFLGGSGQDKRQADGQRERSCNWQCVGVLWWNREGCGQWRRPLVLILLGYELLASSGRFWSPVGVRCLQLRPIGDRDCSLTGCVSTVCRASIVTQVFQADPFSLITGPGLFLFSDADLPTPFLASLAVATVRDCYGEALELDYVTAATMAAASDVAIGVAADGGGDSGGGGGGGRSPLSSAVMLGRAHDMRAAVAAMAAEMRSAAVQRCERGGVDRAALERLARVAGALPPLRVARQVDGPVANIQAGEYRLSEEAALVEEGA